MLAGQSATEAAIGHAHIVLAVSIAMTVLWLLVLLYLVRTRSKFRPRGPSG